MLQAKKFPTLQEREKITTLSTYHKLYDNEQFAVLGLHDLIKKQYKNEKDIVYISHPIPSRISDFYGDFVAGDTDKMIFKVTDVGQQKIVDEIVYENDLKEKLADFATTQSIAGLTWLYIWIDDNDICHIDEISPDQVFPQADGSIVITTYKKDPVDELNKNLLLLTQHFALVNGKVLIKREAWKCDEKGVISETLPLEKMSDIVGRILEKESTIDIDELPFRKVSNGKDDKSDYSDIIPQLAEINERVTQNSTQFLKNLDAKLQLPAGMANTDGKVDPFDYILVDSKEQPQASYILNSNPLMSDAREHIMHELKTIEIATGVPMWALTKSSMPERVESLNIQMFQAIRRTNRKRAKLKRAIQDMFRIAFKLKNILDAKEDVNIKFSDVLPQDSSVQTDIEVSKTQGGLSSRKSSLMRLEGYTEEEADKELLRIKEEDTQAGVVAPPTL